MKCTKITEANVNSSLERKVFRSIFSKAISKDVDSTAGGNQEVMIDSSDLSVVVHSLTFDRRFVSLLGIKCGLFYIYTDLKCLISVSVKIVYNMESYVTEHLHQISDLTFVSFSQVWTLENGWISEN